MRSKKLKLAAVVLSAIMAAGTMPATAFAEDFDVAEVYVDEPALVEEEVTVLPEETVVESEEEVRASVTSPGYHVDGKSVKFHYGETGENAKPDFTVTYTEKQVEGDKTYEDEATATTLKKTDATCTDPGYLWMTITIDGEVFNSGNLQDNTTAFVVTGTKALGHDYVEVPNTRFIDSMPTCTVDGSGHAHFKCSRCGDEKDDNLVLDHYGHDYGEVQTKYTAVSNIKTENGKIVFDANGVPVLDDDQYDGYYEIDKYQVCKNDASHVLHVTEGDVTYPKTEVVYAKKVVNAVITDTKDIATNVASTMKNKTMEEFRTLYPKDTDIELANCNKAGQYQVTYYNGDGKPVSQKWFTVAPHHMETEVVLEFNTIDDKNQCTVTRKADGTYEVKNNSCYLPVTYYEVTHCTAAGCPNKACATKETKTGKNAGEYEHYTCENRTLKEVSRIDKTAQPEGKHIINTTFKEKLAEKNGDYTETINGKTYVKYDAVEAYAKVAGNYVSVSKNNATCTEDGTVTVSFKCKICQKTIEETTVATKALGHKWNDPKGENYQEPKCNALGSYDVAIYCDRCGAEKEGSRRTGIKIPRTKHTNEISVDTNGIGVDDTSTDKTAYIKFIGDKVVDFDGEYLEAAKDSDWYINDNWIGGYGNYYAHKSELALQAYVYTNCESCQDHEVRLMNTYTETDEDDPDYEYTYSSPKTVKFTILDITKQKEDGEAGSITVKATYTKADGSSISENATVPYFSSVEAYQSRTVKAPKNGLVKDEDGVYRYYKNNAFQSDFSGIVEYNGGEFFVAKGVLCSEANGLNEYNGKWYYLSAGQIQRGYNGLALYDGEWFYLNNGELNATVNGLVPYDGGTFLFAEGRLVKEHNGLWQNFDGKWYFLALGQVQNQHTGVAEYDGAFFYVKAGQLATDYNGTVNYDGHTFNVVAGQLYDQVA